MPASYPNASKAFTTKTAGQTIDPNHINDLQLEVTAIENDLIAGLPMARGGTGLTSAPANTRIPYSNGTTLTSAANFLFDGTTFTTPGQIAFPAVQNPSTDVNTLDDYEEGDWTPVDASGAGLSFSVAAGHYVKIGKLVFVGFSVTYPATADGTAAKVGGLPFTAKTTAAAMFGGAYTVSTEATATGALVNSNTTNFSIVQVSAGASVTNATMSSDTIRGSICYIASA